MYLIYSYEHRAWWLPTRRGYTGYLADAGRFTPEEAYDIVKNANIVRIEELAIPESWALQHGAPTCHPYGD